MTEGLFILTTIFVAYVVYAIKSDSKDKKPAAKPTPASKKTAAKPKAPAKPKPAAKATKKPSAPKQSPEKPAAAPAVSASKELKNPKTGEIATISSNYRFTKRWIKDALVEEGLLDKVYKGNELDDAAIKKIDAAFEKIKALKKYQA